MAKITPDKFVRIDDFPHGSKSDFLHEINAERYYYRRHTKSMFDTLNENKTPFLLGVSPLLLVDGDIEFLNDNLGEYGTVCIHGFDHGWSSVKDWGKVVDTWSTGGEFSGLDIQTILDLYNRSFDKLSKCSNFDERHFIPPFNCVNQEVLTALESTQTEFVHCCDKEFYTYKYDALRFGRLKLIQSVWQVTYGDIDVVIRNQNHPSQITLHWIYDKNRPNWLKEYSQLKL